MSFVWTDLAVRTALGLRADLADPELSFTGVSTDSRTTGEGALYVALVGDRFDGHDFVADALARGARGAVVSKPVAGKGDAPLYPVDDTLVALGRLAAHRRDALQVPVVGITGSSGKTSTKELTAAALGRTYAVHATRGNLNNRIGMPLTLLSAGDDVQVVVLEMGTNEPGEIAALAAVARPDIAVVTTVGESHLEKLGSVEGVLEEKLDIVRGMAEGGRAVVGDRPLMLVEGARRIAADVRVAGWTDDADPDLRPVDAEMDHWGTWAFTWKGRRVRLAVPGRHSVGNALLALAVSDFLSVPPKDAAAGLSDVQARAMRGEVRRVGDLTLLVDCYNANPQSVAAALELLEAQAAPRKVAVLGTMLELGPDSAAIHARVLGEALEREVDLVVATGSFAAAAAGQADARLLTAPGWKEAYPALRARLEGDEVVLLKASRGVAMEGILPLLEADFAGAPAGGEG